MCDMIEAHRVRIQERQRSGVIFGLLRRPLRSTYSSVWFRGALLGPQGASEGLLRLIDTDPSPLWPISLFHYFELT